MKTILPKPDFKRRKKTSYKESELGLTRAATRISRPIFSKDLVSSPTTSSPTYKQSKQNQYKSNRSILKPLVLNITQ